MTHAEKQYNYIISQMVHFFKFLVGLFQRVIPVADQVTNA